MTTELVEQFNEINRDLDRCSQLALRQPLPNRQLVLMTDASFTAAGYAILTEDDPNQKYTSVKKSYAPIAYDSKTFSFPAQNVNICERISRRILRLQGIRTYILGDTQTSDYPHGQQIGHEVLPDQDNTATIMECK